MDCAGDAGEAEEEGCVLVEAPGGRAVQPGGDAAGLCFEGAWRKS